MNSVYSLLKPLLKKAPSKYNAHASDYTVHDRITRERGGQSICFSGSDFTNACMEISLPGEPQPCILAHKQDLTISEVVRQKVVAAISELRVQMVLGSDLSKQMDLLHEIEKSLTDDNSK